MGRYAWTLIILSLLLGQIGLAQDTAETNRRNHHPTTTAHHVRLRHRAKATPVASSVAQDPAQPQVNQLPAPASNANSAARNVPARNSAPSQAGTSLAILAFIGFGVLAGGLLSAMKTPSINHD